MSVKAMKDFMSMSSGFKSHSLEGLFLTQHPLAKDLALEVLRKKDDPSTIKSILNMIYDQKIKFPEELIKAFIVSDADINIKSAAIRALGFLKGPVELDTYLGFLNSEDEILISAAIDAFKWSPRISFDWLLGRIEDGEIQNQDSTGQALKELGQFIFERDSSQGAEISIQTARVSYAEYYPRGGGSERKTIKVTGSDFYNVPGRNDYTDMCTNIDLRNWYNAEEIFSQSSSFYQGRVAHKATGHARVAVRSSNGRFEDYGTGTLISLT